MRTDQPTNQPTIEISDRPLHNKSPDLGHLAEVYDVGPPDRHDAVSARGVRPARLRRQARRRRRVRDLELHLVAARRGEEVDAAPLAAVELLIR